MNYYNEHDPKAAAWLRELIKDGLISNGVVDERDIQNVKPTELAGYNQCHFFAGIGGWSYALRLAGISDDEPIWTGSCPCQPFSQSGKGLCEDDERHLWPDFRNLIGECRPAIVFGEQVAGAAGREWLAGVSANLETLAYRFGAADLCAAGIGSPNIRQRLYWVADSEGNRLSRKQVARSRRPGTSYDCTTNGLADAKCQQEHQKQQRPAAHEGERCPDISGGCSMAHRLVQPNRTGRHAGQQGSPSLGHRYSALATGDIVRLVDTNEPGQQRWGERLEECPHQWPPGTPNLIVRCRDGKARRIESETFPLADGFPSRVGLLRGSGNAINPWLAVEFIKAALGDETLTEVS